MAVGPSAYLANKYLDALGNNVSFTVALAYIKLHTADPGSAGATAAATETTRKSISFGVSAAGLMSNDVAIEWTNVAGTEDYTHFSLWDAATAGNFLLSGVITANAVVTADTFTIPIGDLDLTITPAS